MNNKEELVSKLTKAEHARIHALSAEMPKWFVARFSRGCHEDDLDNMIFDAHKAWLDYCVEQALGE